MSEVRDNPALGRVEMTSSGGTAFVEYRRAGERIAPLHTEMPEALSGQGVGSKLVRGTPYALRAGGRRSCRAASSWPPTSRPTPSTGTC